MSEFFCPACRQRVEVAVPACLGCGLGRPSSGWPRDPFVGRLIEGKYRIESRLGAGGMGAVFRATHVHGSFELGQVVLKFLYPHLAENPTICTRFVNEARAAREVMSPHVVKVFDLGFDEDGAPYMVQEYLRGDSVGRFLETRGAFAMERTLRIVMQVAEAMDECHGKGILHRDLKPDNILLMQQREGDFVKIIDFGIARVPQPHGRVTTSLIGTPRYMPPEQLLQKDLDSGVDIFALGVILFEMLTAEPPILADLPLQYLQLNVSQEPRRLRELLPDSSPALDDLCARMIAKERSARPASMGEVYGEVRQLLGEEMALKQALEQDQAQLEAGSAAPLAPVPAPSSSAPSSSAAAASVKASSTGLPARRSRTPEPAERAGDTQRQPLGLRGAAARGSNGLRARGTGPDGTIADPRVAGKAVAAKGGGVRQPAEVAEVEVAAGATIAAASSSAVTTAPGLRTPPGLGSLLARRERLAADRADLAEPGFADSDVVDELEDFGHGDLAEVTDTSGAAVVAVRAATIDRAHHAGEVGEVDDEVDQAGQVGEANENGESDARVAARGALVSGRGDVRRQQAARVGFAVTLPSGAGAHGPQRPATGPRPAARSATEPSLETRGESLRPRARQVSETEVALAEVQRRVPWRWLAVGGGLLGVLALVIGLWPPLDGGVATSPSARDVTPAAALPDAGVAAREAGAAGDQLLRANAGPGGVRLLGPGTSSDRQDGGPPPDVARAATEEPTATHAPPRRGKRRSPPARPPGAAGEAFPWEKVGGLR